jgi:SAM-dependent methyltransferase
MTSPKMHARIYRLLDDLQALLQPARTDFRKQLLHSLAEARAQRPFVDYGAGYLYQSFPRLGLRGFRRTEVRAAQMNIASALVNRSVLEIGCNSGFLSMTLAPGTRRYVAFDNNPYLIDIAKLAQRELGDGQVDFSVDTIEAFALIKRFEVVLSFANHSTWDGNMTLPLDAYFEKIRTLLVEGGLLFFESHHPVLENDSQLRNTLQVMGRHFLLDAPRKLTEGSAWDRGRTFVRAVAR